MAEPKAPEKEELEQVEESKKVEESQKESPKEKEPEEPQEPETEPEPASAEEPEEKPPSRRENLRIQKLVQQRDEAEARAAAPEVPKGGLDYSTALEADPEVVKQLEADRKAYGENLYLQGVQQANAIRFQTRLEVDAPRIEAKHPQLDKESSDFHPVLADAINSMYLSAVGYDGKTGHVNNPNIRYSDYVESVFELASEIAGQQTSQTRKSIAKQAASTGLRPDGGSSKKLNLNKAPHEMTNEELEAVIGMSMK